MKDKTWDPKSTNKQQNFSSSDSEVSDLVPNFDKIVEDKDHHLPLSNTREQKQKQKRSRWSKSNPSNWAKNVVKQRRYDCLPYKSQKGIREAKLPRPVNCTKCKFKCAENFNEDCRVEICKMFWGLSNYQRQKDFILKHVHSSIPRRPNANIPLNKRRQCSRSFFLSFF